MMDLEQGDAKAQVMWILMGNFGISVWLSCISHSMFGVAEEFDPPRAFLFVFMAYSQPVKAMVPVAYSYAVDLYYL